MLGVGPAPHFSKRIELPSRMPSQISPDFVQPARSSRALPLNAPTWIPPSNAGWLGN